MSDRLVTRPWLTKNFAGGSLATGASRSARARGLVEQGRRFASRGVTTGRMVDEPEGRARPASAAVRASTVVLRTNAAAERQIRRTYDRGMLLALDIGNTNLTLGLVDGGEIRHVR